MHAIPTTTVTVLRGTSTDGFGDTVSADTVAASGVLFSLLEQRRSVFTAGDNRIQQVRYFTGRAPGDADIRLGDRVRDESTGDTYYVDTVTLVGSPVQVNDIRCDLRKPS
jgi:hypothetical protein